MKDANNILKIRFCLFPSLFIEYLGSETTRELVIFSFFHTSPKTNDWIPTMGLGKGGLRLQIWPGLVSMLDFWGVVQFLFDYLWSVMWFHRFFLGLNWHETRSPIGWFEYDEWCTEWPSVSEFSNLKLLVLNCLNCKNTILFFWLVNPTIYT